MFKKFSTVVMCIILLLSFAACDKEKIDQNNSEINQTDHSPTNDFAKEFVFKTKDINRITFYAYYGAGNGSNVPAKYLDEIITWLSSFKIDSDRMVTEVIAPGTNTINVEIEYLDGSVVKQGLDTTVIDGVTYYISGDAPPECYNEIISKINLN